MFFFFILVVGKKVRDDFRIIGTHDFVVVSFNSVLKRSKNNDPLSVTMMSGKGPEVVCGKEGDGVWLLGVSVSVWRGGRSGSRCISLSLI